MESKIVHLCTWAAHGDILIACDKANGRIGDRAAWVQPEGLPEGVYLRDDGRLYSFEEGPVVTCPECK